MRHPSNHGKSPGLVPGELTRQVIHIGAGLLAFGLPRWGPLPLMAVALAGLVFNAWVFPRMGGRWLWRRDEEEADFAVGMVLYPLTVFLLLLIFHRRLEVAAAGWGLLAFGDGAASIFGRQWGRRRLPWNASKSWVGLVAYWVAGWISVVTLVAWTAPGRYGDLFLFLVAGSVALLAAFLESSPQRLDDNLGVPLVASLFLWGLLWTEGGWTALGEPAFVRRLILGLAINAVFATVGYALATLDRNGALTGGLIGTAIFAFLGWPGYLVLLVFFIQGSWATRIGYERKAQRRVAEREGGRRRASNALANGGTAAACALLAGLTPYESVFALAFVGSLAAAAADTVESEIGQLWGHPTLLITTLRPVEPGTDGGVSPLGTLAGLLTAGLTVGVAWAGGLCPPGLALPLTLVAVLATLLESVAGATLERAHLLNNDGVNFLNTLTGALMGAWLGLR